MWGIASTTAAFTAAATDGGTAIALVVTTVVGAWIALVGLSYGLRKLTKYVAGHKF